MNKAVQSVSFLKITQHIEIAMKKPLIKHFLPFLYIAFAILLVSTSCTRRLARAVKPSDLPADLASTNLLVQKFEYQDPKIYDSFTVINTDSLQKKTGFTFNANEDKTDKDIKADEKEVAKEDKNREKEHPLIVKTNANLDKYNKKLERSMKVSKYPYEIVGKNEIDSNQKYADVDKFRYVLMRRPELHCYEDPNRQTQLSYRYVHQFYDRKTKTYFTDIEIFSPKPWRTTKAIMMSANKNLKR
ncbi:MAG: hypothetical protein EOP53_02185 [Sphingobacteriales bacterium]|nr:MAG: hypothetical protein EOP53_02185 [Sphingobacteriales bacterium]